MASACAAVMADGVAALGWSRIAAELDAHDHAVASGVLRRSGAVSTTASRILFPKWSAISPPPRPHQFSGIANRSTETVGITVRYPDDLRV
jgi:hypothetical protein